MGFWSRRRPAEATGAEDSLLKRFGGTCPVCGSVLGTQAEQSPGTGRFTTPPSLQLEVGTPDRQERYPWRVSIVHGNFRPSVSADPAFSEDEVDDIYLLCGGGHVFPLATPVLSTGHARRHNSAQRVDEWNMVAAVGAPASGKTYLLLRMLSQNLIDGNLDFDNQNRIWLRRLSPLESFPLTTRALLYDQTRSKNEFILPTAMDTASRPAGMLDLLLPEALEEIRELIRKTVTDGNHRADNWGMGVRQPLVLRTDTEGRRTWTGIADLPGELFNGAVKNRREAVKLRTYNALIWVIDPAIAPNALESLFSNAISLAGNEVTAPEEDVHQMVLGGSLRPGSSALLGTKFVRDEREIIQSNIGRELTLLDGELADPHNAMELLITITKCDLIYTALRAKDLFAIGGKDQTLEGATAYLLLLAKRFEEGRVGADQPAAELLEQVTGGYGSDRAGRRSRAEHFATGLLSFYSDPENFWNLVHTGEATEIQLAADGTRSGSWRIPVASISRHLSAALTPGAQRKVLIRDLMMSVVGCGISFGLVGREAILSILQTPSQNVRFFLCSPLTTVPVEQRDSMDPDHYLLTPLAKDVLFPRASDRSAALTQLLLASLTKARPS